MPMFMNNPRHLFTCRCVCTETNLSLSYHNTSLSVSETINSVSFCLACIIPSSNNSLGFSLLKGFRHFPQVSHFQPHYLQSV
ncbi:hypothetical protein XENTR_v10003287 [Xenopus tropicalis]|nr:hypothetical protein XENTR_v10003287 [Xenopus tropicalis]